MMFFIFRVEIWKDISNPNFFRILLTDKDDMLGWWEDFYGWDLFMRWTINTLRKTDILACIIYNLIKIE